MRLWVAVLAAIILPGCVAAPASQRAVPQTAMPIDQSVVESDKKTIDDLVSCVYDTAAALTRTNDLPEQIAETAISKCSLEYYRYLTLYPGDEWWARQAEQFRLVLQNDAENVAKTIYSRMKKPRPSIRKPERGRGYDI